MHVALGEVGGVAVGETRMAAGQGCELLRDPVLPEVAPERRGIYSHWASFLSASLVMF